MFIPLFSSLYIFFKINVYTYTLYEYCKLCVLPKNVALSSLFAKLFVYCKCKGMLEKDENSLIQPKYIFSRIGKIFRIYIVNNKTSTIGYIPACLSTKISKKFLVN